MKAKQGGSVMWNELVLKRKRKPTNMGKYSKITIIFWKIVVPRTKTSWRQLKCQRATTSSKDKRSDLTKEMLSYNLTELQFANLKNPLFFKKKQMISKFIANINLLLKE